MIETWLLVLTLFIPRISLLIAYFSHQIPYNNLPFVGDLLLYIFLPRVLMVIYIYDNLGWQSPWFWIHIVMAIIVWSKGSHETYKRKFRK
ncbi:MAG: hypothetical protein L0Y79_11070 [Chlorobi bacterium]|nr:hypothetical protein [Chlorobiota bacterium]MCI0716430.1 hypothetical protein [Chlorobiota bacterium]